MTFWTSSDDEAGTEDLAAWLASIGSEGTDGWTNGDDAPGLAAEPAVDFDVIGLDPGSDGFSAGAGGDEQSVS